MNKYVRAVYRQLFGLNVPAATDTSATMVEQQRKGFFLCGPCREVISETMFRA
jgi:hypothetical protein